MGSVQFLRPRQDLPGIRMAIGMMLFGKQGIGRADLRKRAAAVGTQAVSMQLEAGRSVGRSGDAPVAGSVRGALAASLSRVL